jgi:Isochorismatase family
MCLREITTQIPVPTSIAIVGIESHVCVLQTTLDLLKAGHKVYVLADGVSSCNREEIPVALERMRQAGAFVSTSESFVLSLLPILSPCHGQVLPWSYHRGHAMGSYHGKRLHSARQTDTTN